MGLKSGFLGGSFSGLGIPEVCQEVVELPEPYVTYLFKDLYKEIIIRSPKKVGSVGSRYTIISREVAAKMSQLGVLDRET